MRPRNRLPAFVTLTTAALAAACGSDPTGSIPASPAAGVYTLRTINGSPLPAVYASTPLVRTVLADTLRLAANQTYTEVALTQTAAPGQAATKVDTVRTNGTWIDAGSLITIGNVGTASFSGDTLTLTTANVQGASGGSVTQVYVK